MKAVNLFPTGKLDLDVGVRPLASLRPSGVSLGTQQLRKVGLNPAENRILEGVRQRWEHVIEGKSPAERKTWLDRRNGIYLVDREKTTKVQIPDNVHVAVSDWQLAAGGRLLVGSEEYAHHFVNQEGELIASVDVMKDLEQPSCNTRLAMIAGQRWLDGQIIEAKGEDALLITAFAMANRYGDIPEEWKTAMRIPMLISGIEALLQGHAPSIKYLPSQSLRKVALQMDLSPDKSAVYVLHRDRLVVRSPNNFRGKPLATLNLKSIKRDQTRKFGFWMTSSQSGDVQSGYLLVIAEPNGVVRLFQPPAAGQNEFVELGRQDFPQLLKSQNVPMTGQQKEVIKDGPVYLHNHWDENSRQYLKIRYGEGGDARRLKLDAVVNNNRLDFAAPASSTQKSHFCLTFPKLEAIQQKLDAASRRSQKKEILKEGFQPFFDELRGWLKSQGLESEMQVTVEASYFGQLYVFASPDTIKKLSDALDKNELFAGLEKPEVASVPDVPVVI